MERVERILESADLDLPGSQPTVGPGPAGGQSGGDLGIAGARGTAGASLRQSVELEHDAGGLGQLGEQFALDPLHPPALLATVEEQHGRHRVGVKALGHGQALVDLRDPAQSQPLRLTGGLLGRGLREHAHAGGVERRQHLVADRAVVLDQGEQLGHRRQLLLGTQPAGNAPAGISPG